MHDGALPLAYVGGPTVADITPCDLMTRLYAFADDSFLGRAVGTESNNRATDYLAREARRLGLVPMGDSGGYFQRIPVFARGFDTMSTVTAAGNVYHGGTDFLMETVGQLHDLHGVPAVYGGTAYDTLHPPPLDSVKGRFLLVIAAPPPTDPALLRSRGLQTWLAIVRSAAAVGSIGPEEIPVPALRRAITPAGVFSSSAGEAQLVFLVTPRMADAMLGRRVASAAIGQPGVAVSTSLREHQIPLPGRNVVAAIRGRDPALRNEYVMLSAHSDFIAPTLPRDPDSVRAVDIASRPQGAESGNTSPTDAGWRRIFALLDSLHRLHPRRADSIFNGADGSGSGSVSLLELAEAIAARPVPFRRSVLLVWSSGQMAGDWGSRYFADHPPVPLGSIVAQFDLDGIGRGSANDVTGTTVNGAPLHGGENYLQVIGARRLSADLGNIIDRTDSDHAVTLDSAMDAHGHPLRMSCRGDRAMYEAHGIPAVWFTTGSHVDFHEITDEPEYIGYRHMALIDRFVLDVVRVVADRDQRPMLNGPPRTTWTCNQ